MAAAQEHPEDMSEDGAEEAFDVSKTSVDMCCISVSFLQNLIDKDKIIRNVDALVPLTQDVFVS